MSGFGFYINNIWNHGISLYELEVKLLPFRARSYDQLANALRMTGQYKEDLNKYILVSEMKKAGETVKEDNAVLNSVNQIEYIDSLYKKALEKGGKNARINYDYGMFLQDLKLNEAAAGRYKKAIELDSGLKDAYFGLVILYMQSGQKAEALSEIKIIADKFQLDEKVMLNLCMIILDGLSEDTENNDLKGLFQIAFERLALVINSEKPKAASFYNLGLIYSRTGELDRAILSYRRALEIDPRSVDSIFNLANLYKRLGLKGDAEALYKKALDVSPKKIESYINLGNLYWSDGKSDLARETYEKALKIDSHNPKVYYHLGIIEDLSGNKGKALKLYESAVKIDPKFSNVWVNMGNIHAEMGKDDAARDCYQKSVENDRNFLVGWLKLYALTFKNRQYELSAGYLKEAVLLGYEAPSDVLDVLKSYM